MYLLTLAATAAILHSAPSAHATSLSPELFARANEIRSFSLLLLSICLLATCNLIFPGFRRKRRRD